MQDMGIVRGAAEQAIPVVIGKTTVYVHTDIEPVEDTPELYQYREIQYGKDEYIQMMAEQSAGTDKILNALLGVDE
jgi:hypothetical protein